MKLLEYRPTPLLPSAGDRAMNRELYAGAAALNGAARSETHEATGNAPGEHDVRELTKKLLTTPDRRVAGARRDAAGVLRG